MTPNEYFNRHIDELSRELEIDKIKRYTVEEYYVQLIERLSLDDYDSIQENNSWVRIPKIKLPSAKLKSEKGLHDSMLSEIYSLDYQAELKRIYEDLWNRFEETVKPYDFGKYVQATKTGLPVITNHTYETYRRIRAFYMELLAAVTQHENEIRAAKEGLRRIDRVLPEYRQRLADAELSMVETKSKIHDRMTEMLDGIRQQDKETDARLKSLLAEMDALQTKKSALAEVSSDVFTEKEAQMTDEELASYAYIMTAQSPYASYMREKCGDQISEISRAQSQLEAVPFYNFGKKASIKRWIEKLMNAFGSEALAITVF